VKEGKDLAVRLKDLAVRRFGCTPNQIRRAAFTFGNNRAINHSWDKQKMSAGKDLFSGFMITTSQVNLILTCSRTIQNHPIKKLEQRKSILQALSSLLTHSLHDAAYYLKS
jgi:hypothetical protein